MISANSIEINDNEVHYWYTLLELTEKQQQKYLSLLDEEEVKRCQQIPTTVGRQRFIASHGYLRLILAKYLDEKPESLCFKRAIGGKPYIGNENPKKVEFNISHSSNLAIYAIRKNLPVGVDVEIINQNRPWLALSQRFFNKEEAADIAASLDENQIRRSFLKYWTAKEAYGKAIGRGVFAILKGTTFIITPEKTLFHAPLTGEVSTEGKWEFWHLSLADQYVACITAQGTNLQLINQNFCLVNNE